RKPASRAIINNMLSIIIDPNRLGTAANLSAETAEFVEWVKQSPVAQGVERIRIAGEPERDSRQRRGAEGIPVDTTTWNEIVAAGESLGLKRPDMERLAQIA
ncbi:MAG TPA: Ldh family oxidoreductase, partial [Skermanella sp.]|nr:Ldh family oxidoreductase [Skermanella sp.]